MNALPTYRSHKKAQFSTEHNVEYKIINRFKLAKLIASEHGIFLTEEAVRDLSLLKKEALARGLTVTELNDLTDRASRELFTENKFGSFLLKTIRKVVANPLTVDGVIRKGRLNKLAAYGIQIPGLTGNFALSRNIRNLVTNAGFAGIASRINGAGSEAAFTYIAVGTGTTAAAAADTTLETEVADSGLSRANSTASRVTTTQTNDTAQLVNTFTVTGTKAVTESGVLNAASNGVLLCRQVFSAINVVNGDSLQVTWKVKAAAA